MTSLLWQLYANTQCKALGDRMKKPQAFKRLNIFYILFNIQADEK